MRGKRLFSKVLFGGVILLGIGIAIFGYLTFEDGIAAMKRARQENISWSASQLERELTRFLDSLGAARAGTSSSSVEINQRYDVLWSRVAVFQRGKVGARLRAYDTGNVVKRLFGELKRQEVAVVSIKSFDFTSMANISVAFYPYGAALHELSRRITFGEEEKAASIRAQMRDSADYARDASILTVILIIGALFYFVYEGQKYRILADRNKILSDKFKAASDVKSRFLTMMSHELRTPMNGVLGLLAVARDSEADPDKLRVLDQVDRSANRMFEMLSDIIDYAALEDAALDIVNKPFFSHELQLALPELLGPVAAQAKATLKVLQTADIPMVLCGDETRLRRSYALLITYFLETAGAQKIEVNFSYIDGLLRARILVDYIGEGWTPDLIFGERCDSKDQFGADALGPRMARTLVAKMNGRIKMPPSTGAGVEVCIEVPVKALTPKTLNILLDLGSTAMELICKAAVAGMPVAFFQGETPSEIDAICLEAGKENNCEHLATLRRQYPKARIFGVGRPLHPEKFDDVVDLPLESAHLKSTMTDLLR